MMGLTISRWDHPRIRGEHARLTERTDIRDGSSPHTRGALLYGMLYLFMRGIIPAYAGSTLQPVPGGFL